MFKKIENAKLAVVTYITGQPKLVIYVIIFGIAFALAIALNSGVATSSRPSSFVDTFSISNLGRAHVSQYSWLNYTHYAFSISYPSNWIRQPDITTCCGDGEAFLPYSQFGSPPEVDVTAKPQGDLSCR
jgi:hypothetical protein